MSKHLVIATRGSALALWQANHVKEQLQELDPTLTVSIDVIRTKGDIITDAPLAKIGGKGLFVKEIEDALLSGRADLAVHSMKDVPMKLPEGLLIGCVPPREDETDCYLSWKYPSFKNLPVGARVGTSSLRRQAQLLQLRPDLQIATLRGNVDTRLKKLENGEYDAIILASAAISRLGLHAPYMEFFTTDKMLPAVGQGALCIECREDNYNLLVTFASLEDRYTRVCVSAERAFMATLEGGCQIPAACHANMLDEDTIHIDALVAEPDGSTVIKGSREGDASLAEELGRELAMELLDKGARKILEKLLA